MLAAIGENVENLAEVLQDLLLQRRSPLRAIAVEVAGCLPHLAAYSEFSGSLERIGHCLRGERIAFSQLGRRLFHRLENVIQSQRMIELFSGGDLRSAKVLRRQVFLRQRAAAQFGGLAIQFLLVSQQLAHVAVETAETVPAAQFGKHLLQRVDDFLLILTCLSQWIGDFRARLLAWRLAPSRLRPIGPEPP